MKLSGLKFLIKDISEVKETEQEIIFNAYHNLFVKMYGADIVEAFSFVTKTELKEIIKKDSRVKNSASNLNKIEESFNEFKKNANSELLLIYCGNKLVGFAKLLRLTDDDAKVPEISFIALDKNSERNIWKESVSFISTYFLKNGFKKMYLEIPLKEAPLLIRAYELGFQEDPEDIVDTEKVYTYVLNKKLVNNE